MRCPSYHGHRVCWVVAQEIVAGAMPGSNLQLELSMLGSHAHDADALERCTTAQRVRAGMCTTGNGAESDMQITEGPCMGGGEAQDKGTKGGGWGGEGNSGEGKAGQAEWKEDGGKTRSAESTYLDR